METSIQIPNQDPAAALSAFNPIDRHFASFLGRLADNEPEVQLAAALVSYYRSQGHICLDLEAFDGDGKGRSVPDELRGFSFPNASDWVKRLGASPVVGKPGTFAPLILDDQARLYLHRFPRNLQRFSLRVVLHAGRVKPGARWRCGNIINLPMSRPRTINLAGDRLE